jgi:murein DD-endopeptidase MepM/ murein hydrolase activator NlpD
MRVLAAALLIAAPQSQPAPLQSPVMPACVSSPFGWRHAVGPHAPAGFHNGIDLPAAAGAYVRAAAPGRIVWIRKKGIGGLQVAEQHGALTLIYAHLGSVVPALADGQRTLAAGEPIGRIGRTGVTYGTHVFFAVLLQGRAVDPAPFLGVLPCR